MLAKLEKCGYLIRGYSDMQERYATAYMMHSKLKGFAGCIASAQDTIKKFLGQSTNPYVAWSGGKDSETVLILLSMMGRQDVPLLTQGDDLDWPEKKNFCHGIVECLGFSDYTYAESDVSAIKQFCSGDPSEPIHGTFSHVIKQYATDHERDGVLLGLRTEESCGRRMNRATHGKIYRVASGEWHCTPIADWSGVDVFALIVSSGVPYFHIYDCDSLIPPHKIRCSWMLSPDFLSQGQAAWLRHHFPERFNRLAEINHKLRAYV